MWTCPKCELNNENENDYCSLCGAAKPLADEPPIWADASPSVSAEAASTQEECSTSSASEITPSSDESFHDSNSLREQLEKRQRRCIALKAGVVLCVIIVFILFGCAYIQNDTTYTIYKNAAGQNGQIEQICSIVLLVFALLPAIFILIPLKIRKRNLPITISAISAAAATVYCCVIFFGSVAPSVVPFMIIMSIGCCVILSVQYVQALTEMDNFLFKPRMADKVLAPQCSSVLHENIVSQRQMHSAGTELKSEVKSTTRNGSGTSFDAAEVFDLDM